MDAAQRRLKDEKLVKDVRGHVEELVGKKLPQHSLVKLVREAYQFLGLFVTPVDKAPCMTTRSGIRIVNYLELPERLSDAPTPAERKLRLIHEFAERVAISLPTDPNDPERGTRRVAACDFEIERSVAHNQAEDRRIELGLSPQARRQAPTLEVYFEPAPRFDPMRRMEPVKASALATLHAKYVTGERRRKEQISRFETDKRGVADRKCEQYQTLLKKLKILRKAQDQLALLRKLNVVCSDPSPDGYRRHEVRYEKASLGRTYARGDVVDVTTPDDADTPELKSMQRSASYQGMFSELRPLLAPCLRDIDMVKAFATIITNLARRNGCTALVCPTSSNTHPMGTRG